MKVLVFGALNIDLVFSVDHIVKGGETISGRSLVKSAGGKGANQASALAKAGMEVYLAGKIGADGRFLLELLQSYGVNTGLVTEYEGSTGQALIQLDKNKQNAIVLYAGGNGRNTVADIERTFPNFTRGDIVLLQNEINLTAEIMEAAKKQGLFICLNPSPYDEKIEKLPLDLVDMFFVNEIEGASLVSALGAAAPVAAAPGAAMAKGAAPGAADLPEVLDALVRRFPRSEIILTAGKEGAFYGFKEIREKGDIIDLAVADTTGAGDTFTGYFIAARQKNYSVREALALACKASSIAVSRPGAMESIPLAAEVF
jgi:ribokinase